MALREVKIHKGTVWLGGVPDGFRYDIGDVLEQSIEFSGGARNVLSESRAIALKVIPYLEPGLIGGLGAQFSPQATGAVIVQVAIAKPVRVTSPTFDGGSVTQDNPINVRFAETVLKAAVETIGQVDFIGPGVIRFDKALVHPHDSTVGLFQVLARALIMLMNPALANASDDEIENLVWSLLRKPGVSLMQPDYTDRFVQW
jgi:hypothetical protein